MFPRSLSLITSFRRVPPRIVVITALTSFALLVGAKLMGYPLYLIGLYTLLPWVPLLFFEFLWKYEHYNWMAVFAVVTLLQVGHIGEHIVQVTQLAALGGVGSCPPPVDNAANAARAVALGLRPAGQAATGLTTARMVLPKGATGFPLGDGDGQQRLVPPACGLFGQLDFEAVHLVWDTLVWLGALWLLTRFPGNRWLWVAMIAASLHEIEHLFLGWIFFFEPDKIFTYSLQLWATTVQGNIVTAHPVGLMAELATFYDAGGKVGLLAKNGMAEALLGTRNLLPIRPYLHFGYNLMVVAPTVLAFLAQVRRVYDEYLARALPALTEDQLVQATPRLKSLKFKPGAVIVRQGEVAERFFIITRGQVEVVRDGQVERLGQGRHFGEAGL